MARDTDNRLKSQSEATEEVTTKGFGRAPDGRISVRAGYRDATQPVRDAMGSTRQWFEELPAGFRYLVIAAVIWASAVFAGRAALVRGEPGDDARLR